jgi:hypothetical protein
VDAGFRKKIMLKQQARAIFHAAQKEHPDGRILLRRGARTIADSAE